MTFAFAQPLKILAIGGSLITSTSLWFFKPHVPLPIQTQTRTSEQPSAKVSIVDEDENINSFKPAPKLANSSLTIKEDPRIVDPKVLADNTSISFVEPTTQKELALSYASNEKVDDFGIGNIMGKRSQYKALSKEEIKIKLFKEHAWFTSSPSASQVDEFNDPLTTEQINNLFTGIDETKAKQLLLSLQRRLEWKHWYPNGNTTYYFGQIPFLSKVDSPDGLKDLKIKYFSDFDSLKEYVHKKVKESCTDNDKACIAYPEELTYHKTDTWKYLGR